MTADLLASVADLEAYLQTDLAPATATLALELATGTVQAMVGQRIVQVIDETVVLDLDAVDNGNRWLELPEAPVTEVSALLVGATAVTDYTVDLSRGRLYRRCGWRVSDLYPLGEPSTVTVTYSHGYAPDDQDLQFARSVVLAAAAGIFDNPNGVVREQIDDYAVQYEAIAGRLEANPAMAVALRRRYGRGRRSSLLLR